MTVTTEIGKARARKEDARLLTGQTNWTDNIQLPGMVHVAFVRSPMAHKRDVHHTRQLDVVGPVRLPGQQPGVFLAGPRLADLGGHGHDAAPWLAARMTARTMFW